MSEVATTSTADSGSEDSSSGEAQPNAEGLSEATATPEQKQAMAQLKEKFKLTVDGEEFEEEVDWNNKEDIKRRLQLAAAAKKRMGEAKEEKRKAFEIVKAFEQDPASILKRLGPKGREAAEKYLLADIEEQMLSPEEKEYRMTKAELAKYKDMEAKQKEEQEKSVKSAQEMKYAQEFQTTIISALEKLGYSKGGLPIPPNLVKNMANLMAKNLDLGLDLTPEDLAEEVHKEKLSDLTLITKDMDGEQLVRFFGTETANKIRKHDLKMLQEKQNQIPQPRAQSTQSSESKTNANRPMTITQWKESLNKE